MAMIILKKKGGGGFSSFFNTKVYFPLKHLNLLSFYQHSQLYIIFVGEWGGELRGSRSEAWMKSHKSEVAIT